ncbi:hypothetical protein ACFV3R_25065 [Streptomyces sp. NPDC059740]|uniref:hypothetical protein n=1 Tax=Streptomyces sp. NPDC059740 TaxID=3346926 RepID=UPI00364D8392
MIQPSPLTDITRYEVSVLPADDINRRYFTLYVEKTRRGKWVVTDGHGGYDRDGNWTPGLTSGIEYADVEDALALARRLAPNVTVNGHTATDAYHRTQAERQ